jgi:flagellar biosynthesis/type III secretory pathway protein FliH
MKPGTILKSASMKTEVRPFFATIPFDPASPTSDVDKVKAACADDRALERQLQTLQAEKQEQELRIEQLASGADQRIAEARALGREEGREKARKETRDAEAARMAVLSKRMETVSADLARRMDSMENLAALLAHDALSHMFGESSQYADLITRMIGEKISRIGVSNVVEICVSQQDFNEGDLAQIGSSDHIKVTVIDGAASGHFTLRLKLGQVDVSLEDEYRHILNHLQDCARLEPAE